MLGYLWRKPTPPPPAITKKHHQRRSPLTGTVFQASILSSSILVLSFSVAPPELLKVEGQGVGSSCTVISGTAIRALWWGGMTKCCEYIRFAPVRCVPLFRSGQGKGGEGRYWRGKIPPCPSMASRSFAHGFVSACRYKPLTNGLKVVPSPQTNKGVSPCLY